MMTEDGNCATQTTNEVDDRPQPQPNVEEDEETGDAVHDQLPNPEEYKTEVAAKTRLDRTNFCMGLAYGCLALSVTVLFVLIIALVASSKSSSEPRPISDPVPAPPTPLNPAPSAPAPEEPSPGVDIFQVAQYVSRQGWSDYFQVNTPHSPQWRAVEWIASQGLPMLPIVPTDEFKERYAMAVIYYALDGDHWGFNVNDPWVSELNICWWNKVIKNVRGEDVVVGVDCGQTSSPRRIVLRQLNITGFVPPEIGLLTKLETLDLSRNSISSTSATQPLPSEFTQLSALKVLNLEDNAIYGGIPSFLGSMTSLMQLILKRNTFTGTVPPSFQKLSDLIVLNMEDNLIGGDLRQFRGLRNLEALLLGNNQLTGQFTEDVFLSWPQILVIDIGDNKLTGSLPGELFALSNLAILDIHGNQFSGEIPHFISVNSKMRFLAMHENNLTGNIRALSFMTQLQHLDVSRNAFTKDIAMPTEFGKLSSLRYLFLAFNDFTPGEIPTEYGSLTNLIDLSLQKTNRFLDVPKQFGNLVQLKMLDLNQNLLNKLPDELGNLSELRFLLLKDNRLMQGIPSSFQQLLKLDTVLLNGNLMVGNAAALCEPRLPVLRRVLSDCGNLICSCCTCCDTEDSPDCHETVWFSGLDPVYDTAYAYEREFYYFRNDTVLYHVEYEPDVRIFDDPAEMDETPNESGSSRLPTPALLGNKTGDEILSEWLDHLAERLSNHTVAPSQADYNVGDASDLIDLAGTADEGYHHVHGPEDLSVVVDEALDNELREECNDC